MRILAVDDEPIVLELLKASLKEGGYEDITFASSARRALQIIADETQPFDCLLLDILMPGMDGIELCQRVRRMPDYAKTPIIMLTRMVEKIYFDKAFSTGATDYVTKPFDPIELKTRVKIAEQIAKTEARLRNDGISIESLKHQLDRKNQIRLSSAFEMDDVQGSIDLRVLENYLLRSTTRRHKMGVIAVKLTNVGDIFSLTSATEFREVISALGDFFSDHLKMYSHFLSYAGNGVFVIVLRGDNSFFYEEWLSTIMRESQELMIQSGIGDAIAVQLRFGPLSQNRSIFPGSASNALEDAIEKAEFEIPSERKNEDRPHGYLHLPRAFLSNAFHGMFH